MCIINNDENNLAGIDFSITNTGVTIVENGKTYFYMFPKNRPQNMLNLRINYIERTKENLNDHMKYIKLANDILKILIKHNVKKVFIEDYALTKIQGYKINLIEATSVLKTILCLNNIEVEKMAVCTIKKQATGYGHCEKDKMLNAFLEVFPDMREEMLRLKKYALDISDSFFVLKTGVSN